MSGMLWFRVDPKAMPDELGYLPLIFSEDDPRPAKEQINDRYGHGGGWNPMPGFELLPGDRLKYPGDPVMQPIYRTLLHDEEIVVYQHSFVLIRQGRDGPWEVARMD